MGSVKHIIDYIILILLFICSFVVMSFDIYSALPFLSLLKCQVIDEDYVIMAFFALPHFW